MNNINLEGIYGQKQTYLKTYADIFTVNLPFTDIHTLTLLLPMKDNLHLK